MTASFQSPSLPRKLTAGIILTESLITDTLLQG